MAGKRIIFIPWKSDEGAKEGVTAATEWNTHAFKKSLASAQSWEEVDVDDKYEIVCFGDAKVARTWSTYDQIYIKGGHCSPGSNVMKNYSGGFTLTADHVAERLIGHFGLGGTFNGSIKLYTCNSAVPGGIYNHSFGNFFVRKFKETCPRATVYGYKGTVSKEHDFKGDDNKMHKSADFKGVEKRASEYRYTLYTPPATL